MPDISKKFTCFQCQSNNCHTAGLLHPKVTSFGRNYDKFSEYSVKCSAHIVTPLLNVQAPVFYYVTDREHWVILMF